MAKDVKASGFAVEILQYIADKENWSFEYIRGSFSQCMKRLKNGDIDIQVGIAYSEQRDNFLDFNRNALLTYYGQVFIKRSSSAESLLELKNKTVGIVKGDIFGKNFKKLAKRFRLNVKYKEYKNFKDVFSAISKGTIFAGTVSILNAPGNEEKYRLRRTSVIFSPINLVYASKEGQNVYALKIIDKHIKKLKEDKSSFYYQTYRKYFLQGYSQKSEFWIYFAPILGVLALMIALIVSYYYRKRIEIRELRINREQANLGRQKEQIEKLVERRTKELTKNLNQEEALQMFTQSLLASEEKSETIHMALSFLFDISLVAQICIFENFINENKGLCAKRVFSVCYDHSYFCSLKNDECLSYSEELKEIKKNLSNGIIINKNVKEFDENLKNYFKKGDVQSVLILPIWTAGKWYGFISFENKKNQNIWQGKEIRMLLTAAEIIGAYFERLETEQALRQSEEKFRTLVEGAYDPIVIFSSYRDKFIFVNMAMKKYLGYSGEEFYNMNVGAVFYGNEQYKELKDNHLKKIEAGENVSSQNEVRLKTKQGKIKIAMVSGNPINYENDLSVVLIIKDITEKKQAEKQMIERLHYEEALAMCSRSLLANIDQEDALGLSLNYLLSASSTDVAFIYTNYEDENGELRMLFTHELSAENIKSLKSNDFLRDMPYSMFHGWQEAMSIGKRVIGNDNTLNKKVYKKFLNQGIKSFLLLPIFTGGEWYGFIGFFDLEGKKEWLEEDIQLLNTASNMIGSFLHRLNSEMYLKNALSELNKKDIIITEDLMMAEKIQSNLMLKNFESIQGLDIEVFFKPMIQVGGDIYDIFELRKNYCRILIADATGHGVQAALMTMLIKSTYDKIKTRGVAPSEIMKMFNQKYIEEYSNLNVYFTAIIIDLDLNKNKILYSIAGHPKPFFISGNTFNILEGKGTLIGVVPDMNYELNSLKINKGDKIFIFSDGIFEEFNDNFIELGEERVIEKFKENAGENVKNTINNLIEYIYEWTGKQSVNDDITLIGIEYK